MPQVKRQSKKRDAILECIRSTKIHPSAEWIYEKLKGEYANISLGTVYRNLAEFREEGLIVSVGFVDGKERFDGDLSPHDHFKCTACGAVLDTKEVQIPEDTVKDIESRSGVRISGRECSFYGLCSNCLNKQGKNIN